MTLDDVAAYIFLEIRNMTRLHGDDKQHNRFDYTPIENMPV
jgi:hypothetical protein